MSETIRTRDTRVIVIGSLLILVGAILLLDRLDLFDFRWNRLFWIVAASLGAFFVVDGFLRKLRGRIFWGSMMFFVSTYYIMLQWRIIDRYSFYTVPAFLIAIGFSLVMLYLHEPREVALLIPAILFIGTGAAAILWWWEVIDWWDVRHAIRTYWPLLFVLWGVALIVRRKPRRPQAVEPPPGPPQSS